MNEETDLMPSQYGAIRRGIVLGRTLQTDHPEIADLYIGGKSFGQIAEHLDIQYEYGVGDNVALKGVKTAVAGHNGRFETKGFRGLIGRVERVRIGREHNRTSSVLCGKDQYEQVKGIHARTVNQSSEDGSKGYKKGLAQRTSKKISGDSRKGGLVSGNRLYADGRGIFARDESQCASDSAKGYLVSLAKRTREQRIEDVNKSNIAQGKSPWSDEEIGFAYDLTSQQKYQHGEESNKSGTPNCTLIALVLNDKYHGGSKIRKRSSVASSLMRYRKSLEDVAR